MTTNNEVQFTNHAVERLYGRLQNVVTYAEVQAALSKKPLRSGFNRVQIKTLSRPVTVTDDSAFNNKVEGNKVFANVQVSNNTEVEVITIALSY